jgi:hypothetical protein
MLKITPNIINKIILFALFVTPIFTFGELMALLNYKTVSMDTVTSQTAIYIKILKDVFVLALFLLAFIFIMKKHKIKNIAFVFFLTFTMILFFSIFLYENMYLYLSGLRWIMPFLLAIVLIGFINEDLLYKIAKIMAYLFILTFILQIYELLYMGSYYGVGMYGLSRRTTGFFQMPTTCGFLVILAFFINYFYGNGKLRKVVLYLTPISLLITFSKTALVVYIISLAVIKFYKNIYILIVSVGILLAISFFILYLYIPDSLTVSLGTRIELLFQNLENMNYFSGNFGQSSNTFLMIKEKFGIEYIEVVGADSLIGAIPVNIAFFGFVVFISLYIILVIISIKYNNKAFTIFLLIYGLFSFTISITEAYPMNLLFAVFLAYYLQSIKIRRI